MAEHQEAPAETWYGYAGHHNAIDGDPRNVVASTARLVRSLRWSTWEMKLLASGSIYAHVHAWHV